MHKNFYNSSHRIFKNDRSDINYLSFFQLFHFVAISSSYLSFNGGRGLFGLLELSLQLFTILPSGAKLTLEARVADSQRLKLVG